MLRAIHSFLNHQDQGQDLAEYCLITAVIVLIALGIFWHISGGFQDIWDTANTALVSGNATSGSGSGSAGTAVTQGNLGH